MPAVFSAKPTFLSTQSLLRSATPSAAALNGRSKTTFISPQRNTASDTGTSTAPPAQSQPKYHDRNAVSATDTTSSRNSGCPHGCAACCFIKLCVFHIICVILNIHISKQSSAAGRGLRISIALIRAVCEPTRALSQQPYGIIQNQRMVRIFSARRTKGRLSSLSGFAAALAACAALSPRPRLRQNHSCPHLSELPLTPPAGQPAAQKRTGCVPVLFLLKFPY